HDNPWIDGPVELLLSRGVRTLILEFPSFTPFDALWIRSSHAPWVIPLDRALLSAATRWTRALFEVGRLRRKVSKYIENAFLNGAASPELVALVREALPQEIL